MSNFTEKKGGRRRCRDRYYERYDFGVDEGPCLDEDVVLTQEREPVLDAVKPRQSSLYEPDLYEEDILYYGVVGQNGEHCDVTIDPTDISLNSTNVVHEQMVVLFNEFTITQEQVHADSEDASIYNYEKEDAEYEAMCIYDSGPRDDYNDDMYD